MVSICLLDLNCIHNTVCRARPSLEDIGQLFEVMSVLEGTCAAIATRTMAEQDLNRLRELHGRLEEHCAAGNQDRYSAVNHEYHTLIQAMTGNPVLMSNLFDKKFFSTDAGSCYAPTGC